MADFEIGSSSCQKQSVELDRLESSLHLYQVPQYRAANGRWFLSFRDAVTNSGSHFTWDVAAILSVLSFNYVCGDRTLLNEVKRQPWLSQVDPDGAVRLEVIPSHGRLRKSHAEIARDLGRLLYEDALRVCQGRKEIYILLSGGLDSRIVAGIVTKLAREGRLIKPPVAVSWGLPDSRDVVYGRLVAQILGIEWVHVSLEAEDIVRNVEECVTKLGCLVSPLHLHGMQWFGNVSEEALVLTGSYGDSVGRAEFSGKHLLELQCLRPINPFGLVNPAIIDMAYEQVQTDLMSFRDRSPGQPRYVLCEHEMHGHYTRGLLGHAMSLISSRCTIYHMFTDPHVYRYMWSLHPAMRSDDVYAELLQQIDPRLARLPWARTNKALRGRTEGARTGLRRGFHEYEAWIGGPLYDTLSRMIDFDWFAETGIFRVESIRALCEIVKRKPRDFRPYERLVWLVGFGRFAQWLNELGNSIELHISKIQPDNTMRHRAVPDGSISSIRQVLGHSQGLTHTVQGVRRFFLRRWALRRYPPQ